MFASTVLHVVFGLAFLIVLLLAVALLSPIVVTLDSTDKQVRFNWLAFIEYLLPLPGTEGKARFLVGGTPVSFGTRMPSSPPPGHVPPSSGSSPRPSRKQEPGPRRSFPARFLRHCLADSVVRRSVAKQVTRLLKGLWRSLVLTRWESRLCLPDPALNGMLMGVLAQGGPSLRSRVGVNFIDENSLFLEVRVYPHRLVRAVLLFLTSLPYMSLFKAWRASSSLEQPR